MPDERDREQTEEPEEEKPSKEAPAEEKRVKTAAEIAAERAAEAADDAAPGAEAEEQPTDAEPEAAEVEGAPETERPEDALPPVTVPDLLKSFCGMLLGQAWQKLGLVVDPTTGEAAEDLDQARLAIDSASVLTERLEGHLTDDEKRELDAALANLRINYVQRASSAEEKQGEGTEAGN